MLARADRAELQLLRTMKPPLSTAPLVAVPLADSANGESFGDFGIGSYDYIAWEEVFPELSSLSAVRTVSQVAHGQALVWLSMRSIFAQYLKYCAVYPEIAGDDIDLAAGQFNDALDDVRQFLADTLKGDSYDMALVKTLEDQLKKRLHERRFNMLAHYEFWIDNYPRSPA